MAESVLIILVAMPMLILFACGVLEVWNPDGDFDLIHQEIAGERERPLL